MAYQDGNSSGDSSRRPPQQLVFMPNFSNPVKDSKRSETRKLVAKYAMINRKSPPNPLPSAGSVNPSTSSGYNRHRSQSGSQSPEAPPRAPPTPEHLSTSYLRQARRDLGHPTADPSFSLTDRSTTQDYYSLPAAQSDLRFCSAPGTGQWQSKIDDAKLRKHAKAKARRRVQEPTPPLSEFGDDDDPVEDGSSCGPTSTSSPVTTLVRTSPGPASVLTAKRDPFDCLPVKHNPHTQELLYLYLNAHFLSPAFTQGSVEIPRRVKAYRQNTWFPLILENRATLNALVAYLESTPDLPIKARTPDFLLNHVQAAYEGMRTALSNPKTEVDDSICVAVVLLMLTAQRLGDNVTFRAHATGLMHLLGARSRTFRHSKLLRDKEHERWHDLNIKINGPPNPDPCKYCLDAHLRPDPRSPSPDSPEPTPVVDPSQDSSGETSSTLEAKIAPSHRRGEGLYDLVARGYLRPVMESFVDQILIWTTLAEEARRDRLAAAAASSHAWVDERPGKMPPLDTACQYAVRLCLYLSSWLEGGHSCTIVRRMTMAVYGSLRNPALDLSELLRECPQALLWLALVAGPFADKDMPRQWFMCLLTRAQHAVAPSGLCDFEELMETTNSYFVWTTTMTPGAQRFWEENVWDVGTATAWMENPF